MSGTLDVWSCLALAVALAMDAFAVSLAAGASLKTIGLRRYFRMSFHLGFFQFAMPVIGWHLGVSLHHMLAVFDHWLAFILLLTIGVRMIRESLHPCAPRMREDPTRGATLVLLSIATSIDALAVGLSLAMLSVTIWRPSIIIGVTTATLSALGIRIGGRLAASYGRRAEFAGGLILLAIGVRILTDHLL